MKLTAEYRIRDILFSLIIIGLPFWCFPDSIYLVNTDNTTKDTIPSRVITGQVYISLAHLVEKLGMDWEWDRYSERFTASTEENTVAFIQNNPFYQINNSTFQLPKPPERDHGNLYVPVEIAADLFKKMSGKPLVWSESEQRLTMGEHADKKASENRVIAENEATLKTPAVIDKKKVTGRKAPEEAVVTVPSVPRTDTTEKMKAEGRVEVIKTVVIDPGHGGKDPGAIGQNGVKEKDVVLSISLALRDILKEKTNLRVYMTRSTDEFIPLRQRTKFANDKKADLFISVHANSIAGNKKKKSYVKGYKIYFLSQAKNEVDKLAAMIENSVIELEEDVQKGDYLQNILIDMANNEFLSESQDLSILIAESFGKALTRVRALQKGVGQANFWVLNGAYMPSVLVETCFISNPNEEKLLTNKKFQKKIAGAISNAVVLFKKKYEAGL